jgi:hypothetical protein
MSDDVSDDDLRRMIRTSGDVICEICGKTGWKHPMWYGHLIDDGLGRMIPWLHEGCDGFLWKF